MQLRVPLVTAAGLLGVMVLLGAMRSWEVDAHETAAVDPLPARPVDQGRWLVVGGGSVPELNQISLEHDVRLASDVLGPGGTMLFAGGPRADGVQVSREEPGDELLLALGDIFQPRGGRQTRYQRTSLDGLAGPSSLDAVHEQLNRDLGTPGSPYLFFFAGHGGYGDVAADNHIYLWGGDVLTARDLSVRLKNAQRPARLVVAACYSGGFAEIAFEDAEPEFGAPDLPHCGLFASTWDRESSGCDPDPDRRRHEGYSIHFLHGLAGRNREGSPLPTHAIDFDGNGEISLLEAHTRARVASTSFDIPTTTSERWLRAMVKDSGPSASVDLPEEDAVIAALGEGRSADTIAREWNALEDRILLLDDALAADQDELEEAYRILAAELLAQWPVLDDPYHPDFWNTLQTHRAEITDALEELESARAVRRLQSKTASAGTTRDDLQRAAARLERVVRALDTRRLAGLLRAQGGSAWNRYAELLACERGTP